MALTRVVDLDADLAAILDTLPEKDALKAKFKEQAICTVADARDVTRDILIELGFTLAGRQLAILRALRCTFISVVHTSTTHTTQQLRPPPRSVVRVP